MSHPEYTERRFGTADELWEALSPTRDLTDWSRRFIYRGQGDASWELIPSLLRPGQSPGKLLWGENCKADQQVITEI
jgi:hypothetical protein